MSRGTYGAPSHSELASMITDGVGVDRPEAKESQGSGGIKTLGLVVASLAAASLAVYAVGKVKDVRSGASRAHRAGRKKVEDSFLETRAESTGQWMTRLSPKVEPRERPEYAESSGAWMNRIGQQNA